MKEKEKGKAKSGGGSKRKIDKYLDACVEHLDFSGSVLVHRKEKIYAAEGYGKADRENNVKNKIQTVHRLASLSKAFTSMAVMMLIDQDKLKLTDKLSNYVPKLPEKWKPITIYHLLTHTSGVANYTELPEFFKRQREPTSPEEVIEMVCRYPLKFTPGKETDYSDSGYTILGHIIERVADQLYGEFLNKWIFEPLGMHNTGYDISEMIIPNRAHGYVRHNKHKILNAPYIDMSMPHAAGALASTIEDMYIWDRALKASILIPKKLTDVMFRPVKGIFACGWMVDELHGRKRIQHAGGIDGFTTSIMRFPQEDALVVVLCNAQSPFFNAFGVAEDLASLLFHANVDYPR